MSILDDESLLDSFRDLVSTASDVECEGSRGRVCFVDFSILLVLDQQVTSVSWKTKEVA